MDKPFFLAVAIAFMLLAQSCAVTTPSYNARKATAKTRFVMESNISETPLVTDLLVEERKVSGSFTGKNTDEESAKSLAVFDALKRANAEILVEPLYEIEVRNNEISAKVQGYPARYVNFRKPTYEDSLLLGLIAPPADTVFIEIEKTVGGGGGGCCCCGPGNNSPANNKTTTTTSTTTIHKNSSPQPASNPFELSQQPAIIDNTKPSEGTLDTQKFKTDYIDEYNRLKAKGRKQLTIGGVFFYILPLSIPMFAAGATNKGKAKRMKREAPQHGINLSLKTPAPCLNAELIAMENNAKYFKCLP